MTTYSKPAMPETIVDVDNLTFLDTYLAGNESRILIGFFPPDDNNNEMEAHAENLGNCKIK